MRILLAGDSWGCGEWKEYHPTIEARGTLLGAVNHKGLEEYLTQDNHEVKNISLPGASLKNIYYKLIQQGKKYLFGGEVDFDFKPYDATFVIVTDPLRDIEKGTLWVASYSYQDYVEIHNNNLYEFISSLNSLDQKKYGQIYLMGGLTKVTSDLVKNTNLKIAIPSILELLVPNSKQHDVIFKHHLHTISKHNTNKAAVKRIYAQNNLWELYTTEPIMWPDGNHPNREGHFKIYQYLKENKFLS